MQIKGKGTTMQGNVIRPSSCRLGGATMSLDTDTLLTAVYCILDDLYRLHAAPHKPVRPGAAPCMSDSEVLTLAVLAQWHPLRQETRVLRYARRHWRAYFPRLLHQSAFNRRARDLWGVFAALAPHVAARLHTALGPASYAAVDALPVPLMRRCRGDRHRLFADEAAVGHGGSDGDWYYGVHLLTCVSDHGAITGWVTAPANTDERWAAESLLRWQHLPAACAPTVDELRPVLGASHRAGGGRRGPTGPIAPALAAGHAAAPVWVADRGYRGEAWRQHWQERWGVSVLTRADYRTLPPADRDAWGAWLSGTRQVVERVHAALTTVYHAPFPQARSWWGLLTRMGAKVLAHNLSLLLAHQHHLPLFTRLDPFG